MVLGECRKHYRNAQDLFAARYPDRQQKSHMSFQRLAERFCRFGTVKQTQVKCLNPHAGKWKKRVELVSDLY